MVIIICKSTALGCATLHKVIIDLGEMVFVPVHVFFYFLDPHDFFDFSCLPDNNILPICGLGSNMRYLLYIIYFIFCQCLSLSLFL